MTLPCFVRSILVAAVIASGGPLFAASAKDAKKAAPPPAAVLNKKPVIKLDSTPVTDGGKSGLVMSYADVLEPAQQAVVSVYSTKIIKERLTINPLLRQFFGNIPDQERESKQEGLGSGVIVTSDGYILTNNHVVEGATKIEVSLYGEDSDQEYAARVVGRDPLTDSALIELTEKPDHTLPEVKFGDSAQMQQGDWVMAIGNPFGLAHTVSVGVISALERPFPTTEGRSTQVLQTDAAINPGNSGGPLLNIRGEVIGINSAIYTPSGTTAGIGFAIPINTAKSIATDLMTDGRVHRAFLGVQTLPIAGYLAEALDLPVKEGLLVESVTRGGPAAAAGIKGGDKVAQAGMRRIAIGGDVMTAIDGQKVGNQLDVNVILNRKRPGDTVTITIYRGGKKMELHVKLTERAENLT
jgi:S1-C subfamily serine protease